MLRYAVRAVPWVRVAVAAVLILVLMDMVRRWPWVMWPLEGIAVGLLAGATGWCFDEPSAAVVDVTPRSLAWRSLGRASGVLVLLGSWTAAVLLARDSLFDHAWEVARQGVAAMLAGAAYVTWRRGAGESTPGLAAAVAVVPAATTWALVRPFPGSLPVFPYAHGGGEFGDWDASRSGWAVLAACAAALLVAALCETRWWRRRRRRRRPPNWAQSHHAGRRLWWR